MRISRILPRFSQSRLGAIVNLGLVKINNMKNEKFGEITLPCVHRWRISQNSFVLILYAELGTRTITPEHVDSQNENMLSV